MKSKNQFRALIGLVFVVAVVVGVLVWPEPKEARAVVNYQIFAYRLVNQVPIGINDAGIKAKFEIAEDEWTGWLDPDVVAGGVYSWEMENWVGDMEALYENGDWMAIDPPANVLEAVPFSATYEWHEWEFFVAP